MLCFTHLSCLVAAVDIKLQGYGYSFTGMKINDIRVVGILLVILLFGIALIGLDWEAKVL